jgi:purine-binding chemotaxis protein CheW
MLPFIPSSAAALLTGTPAVSRRQLVTFKLGDGRYALDAATVQRIVRAVEVTALPKAPPVVAGVIDVRGCIVPVFDLRARFGLPLRPMRLSDQLIIATAAGRTIALLVDAVDDVVEVPADHIVPDHQVLPALDYVEALITTDEGLIFLRDLGTILSLGEAGELDEALAEAET